jgi:hypothetical protein
MRDAARVLTIACGFRQQRSWTMENPEARALSSALQFRPWPIWDPVPWLIDILDKRQLLEIGRIQLQLHREILNAQLKAAEGIDKALGRK